MSETRRNCWTCEHKTRTGKNYGLCRNTTTPGVVKWGMDTEGFVAKMPPHEADGCPGYRREATGG